VEVKRCSPDVTGSEEERRRLALTSRSSSDDGRRSGSGEDGGSSAGLWGSAPSLDGLSCKSKLRMVRAGDGRRFFGTDAVRFEMLSRRFGLYR
jgi:hypothetical protein